jgi:hypothetical protein
VKEGEGQLDGGAWMKKWHLFCLFLPLIVSLVNSKAVSENFTCWRQVLASSIHVSLPK